MIPIRKIEIETEKQTAEIITTLNWHTHPVKNTWIEKTNWFKAKSTRPLIGNIDNENLSFTLTRLRPYIESWIPQIIVKGQLSIKNGHNLIVLKFLPGLYSSILFLFIIYSIGEFLWKVITKPVEADYLMEGIITIIVLLLLTFLLTIWEQNKTKDKILNILQIKSPANNSKL